MTRRQRLHVLGVSAFLLLFAHPATAGLPRWWSWLDELSGPGPFRGLGFGVALWCVAPEDENKDAPGLQARMKDDGRGGKEEVFALQLAKAAGCEDKPEVRGRIHLTLGIARARAEHGYPTIWLWSFEPTYMYPLQARLPPWLKLPARVRRSVDVGGGAGLYVFDIDHVGAKVRPSLHGAVHWYFLQSIRGHADRRFRIIRLEFVPRLFYINLDDAKLGVPNRAAETGEPPFSRKFEEKGWAAVRLTINVPLP